MKVFADKLENSFFKTDQYIKDLHEVEINTIQDFVFRYALDPMILLGAKHWMVKRFDELESGSPCVDDSEEPELHGEWLEIDFVSDMKLLDILHEISRFVAIDSNFIDDLRESGVFEEMAESWLNEDAGELWTISSFNDPRKLCIVFPSFGDFSCYFEDQSH